MLLNGSNTNRDQEAPVDPTTRMDLEDIYPVGSETIGKTLWKLPDDELQDLEKRLELRTCLKELNLRKFKELLIEFDLIENEGIRKQILMIEIYELMKDGQTMPVLELLRTSIKDFESDEFIVGYDDQNYRKMPATELSKIIIFPEKTQGFIDSTNVENLYNI